MVCCRYEVYNKNNKEKITLNRTKISPKETHTGHNKTPIAQISTLCVCVYIRREGETDDQQVCPNVSDFKQPRTYQYRAPCTHNRSVFCDNQPRSNLEGRLKRRRTNKRKIVSLAHSITPSVRRNFLHISV